MTSSVAAIWTVGGQRVSLNITNNISTQPKQFHCHNRPMKASILTISNYTKYIEHQFLPIFCFYAGIIFNITNNISTQPKQLHCHNRPMKAPTLTISNYSRLSLSRSRRDPLKHFKISVLRDIRCAELRKIPNEQPNFHKWTCNLTSLIRNICWKYCGKGGKLLLRSNFSPYPQYFITWC